MMLKIHYEEFLNLYCFQNIIRVIILRRMRLAGHAASLRKIRGSYKNLSGNLNGRDQLGDLVVKVR
jgi:hypothetical protein